MSIIQYKIWKNNMKGGNRMSKGFELSLIVGASVAWARIELDKTWGKFEGVYSIEKVTHNINSGDYTCDLEMLKVGAKEKVIEKAKQ